MVNIMKKDIEDNEESPKTFKDTRTYRIIGTLKKNLKEDKWYLASFIITIIFLLIGCFLKVREAEGIYTPKNENAENTTETKENDSVASATTAEKTEELDVSNYVGYYTHTYTLTSKINLTTTCSIDSYEIIYQIKKDNTINKYLNNTCLGVILLVNDKLNYVTSSGARYIGSSSTNFLFGNGSIKEVDGDTFKIDETITNLKENKKLDTINITNYPNNIALISQSNIYLIKGNSIIFNLNEEYPSTENTLSQRIYNKDTTYYYIQFLAKEDSCLKNNTDDEYYNIYSISYNYEENNFDISIYKTRNVSEGCQSISSDIQELNN